MKDPTVSVIIPTYNREDLLPRALDSVIAQTFEDWEIVLVDDGSTDGTASLADTYSKRLGERIVYTRQPNTGCGGARNRGIDTARGRFVAFLDSDDEYLPNKLERQLELFARRPELGFVYCDHSYIDTSGARYDSVFDTLAPLAREVAYETVAPGLCVCTASLFDVLLREYFIATIVGMVRREVLGDSIRWSSDPSYSAEWFFFLKVARACSAGFVDEPLCLHHFVTGSVTRTDKHRNLLRLRNLLIEMSAAFDDVTHAQRAVIRRHLVRNCRQLGYDAFKAGDYRQAYGYLVEVARRQPGWRALYDLVHVGVRWIGNASMAPRCERSALDP